MDPHVSNHNGNALDPTPARQEECRSMTDKLTMAASVQPGMSDTDQKPTTPASAYNKHLSIATTAQPVLASVVVDTKKPCDISNLMSPPEPAPLDAFNSVLRSNKAGDATMSNGSGSRKIPCPPPSPPVSPYVQASSNTGHEPAPSPSADPILYPSVENTCSPPALFDDGGLGSEIAVAPPLPTKARTARARSTPESVEAARVVDGHIAARPLELFRGVSPPDREDYELTLYFRSSVLAHFRGNPRGWLQQEKELLRGNKRGRKPSMARVRGPERPLLPAKPAQKQEGPRLGVRGTGARVAKPSPKLAQQYPGTTAGAVRAIRVNLGTPAPVPVPVPVPVPMPNVKYTSPTPEPRVRTVAPNREDKDFNSLPDYCPPLNTLPNKPHCLRVEWKGNQLDLSTDPHRDLLHAEELALAACLRLDCATYLTSKRRIFARRLECARIGKEFRKTDAQQACKIDVNKASKLWTAYEKVGWLQSEWMRRHF